MIEVFLQIEVGSGEIPLGHPHLGPADKGFERRGVIFVRAVEGFDGFAVISLPLQVIAQSDLPYGLTGASAFVTGPNAVLAGGETADGALQTSLRANTSPQAPFFQLGPFGATVPGLKIDGELGQQLGYLNAAGAGTLDFVILLIIGWAFAHKPQARAMVSRVVRRRGSRA